MTTAEHNALTQDEKDEIAVFGCTLAQLTNAVETGVKRHRDATSVLMSMLSDVQEMINPEYTGTVDLDSAEEARQALNRAKWILINYVSPDRD